MVGLVSWACSGGGNAMWRLGVVVMDDWVRTDLSG